MSAHRRSTIESRPRPDPSFDRRASTGHSAAPFHRERRLPPSPGAGDSRCLLVAVGARDKSVGENWGGYTVDEKAAKHGASVDQETTKPAEAYAKVAKRAPARPGEDWLPS